MEDKVFARQIELVGANARVGVVSSAFGIPVFGIALLGLHWTHSFDGWALATLAACAGARVWAQWLHRHEQTGLSQRAVTRGYVGLTVPVSAAWGAGILLFFDPRPATVTVMFVLLLAQVIAVMSATVIHLPVFYAFLLPLSLAFFARTLADTSQLALGSALAAALVLTMLTVYTHRMHRVLVTSIRMRFENQALNDALTEQRVQERTRVLEEASRHKSEFLANMWHEMRTPLNAIIGYSEMLQEDAADQGAQGCARPAKIHGAGHHLLALINDVLDLSKIEAGRDGLSLEDFDMPSLLDEVQVDDRPSLRATAIGSSRLRAGARAAARRPDRLRQALINLPATPASSPRRRGSRCARVAREARGAMARRSGARHRHRHQARAARRACSRLSRRPTPRPRGATAAPGSGCRDLPPLLPMMGGDIAVESGPGHGSVFTSPRRAFRRAPASTVAPSPATAAAAPVTCSWWTTTPRCASSSGATGRAEGLPFAAGRRWRAGTGAGAGIEARRDHARHHHGRMDGWTVLAAIGCRPGSRAGSRRDPHHLGRKSTGFALGASEYLVKPIDRERVLGAAPPPARAPGTGRRRRPNDAPVLRRLPEAGAMGWSTPKAAPPLCGATKRACPAPFSLI